MNSEEEPSSEADDTQVVAFDALNIFFQHERIHRLKMARQLDMNALDKALDAIDEAMGLSHDIDEDLVRARQKLLTVTSPIARGAVTAQRLIQTVDTRCTTVQERLIIKRVHREIRDIIILRIRAATEDPTDKVSFLAGCAEAYDNDLHKVQIAQLLLAYHKNPTTQAFGFKSRDRRHGRPRQRRTLKSDLIHPDQV